MMRCVRHGEHIHLDGHVTAAELETAVLPRPMYDMRRPVMADVSSSSNSTAAELHIDAQTGQAQLIGADRAWLGGIYYRVAD